MQHHAFCIKYNCKPPSLITECHVSLSSSIRLTLNQPPNPIGHRALWDTGATGSVISQKLAAALKLLPMGKTEVRGVNGVSTVNVYSVDIYLPNKVIMPNIIVTEADFGGNSEFDTLIGMDLIQLGDFSIANYNGNTWFSYSYPPMENPTDLVEKANRRNKRT